jgi:DNA topoisomerase-1
MKNYIIRKKTNKTYSYYDNKGNKINKNDYDFILKKIYIPPAYDNVKINLNKNSKILAIGSDDKNRKQYIYNSKFTSKQKIKKFNHLYDFGKKYDIINKKINSDLKLNDDLKDKQISIILKLIMDCNFRVGNEKYCKENNSYGVTTLKKQHIKTKNNKIIIDFNGKKNVRNTCDVKNKQIIKSLKYKKKKIKNNQKIFYYKKNNTLSYINSNDVNNYLKQFGNFTTKNFRTWGANTKLISLLVNTNKNEYNLKKVLKRNIDIVSNKLHHTSDVCKKNYIDPEIIKLFLNENSKFHKIFNNNTIETNYTTFLKTLI